MACASPVGFNLGASASHAFLFKERRRDQERSDVSFMTFVFLIISMWNSMTNFWRRASTIVENSARVSYQGAPVGRRPNSIRCISNIFCCEIIVRIAQNKEFSAMTPPNTSAATFCRAG
jgi:hypothetical protein